MEKVSKAKNCASNKLARMIQALNTTDHRKLVPYALEYPDVSDAPNRSKSRLFEAVGLGVWQCSIYTIPKRVSLATTCVHLFECTQVNT